MKLTIASLAAFVSSALAALSINNPVAGTVWAYNGSPVTITWVSDDNTVLTGTVTVQLMEGADTNNLMPILTIASNIAASLGKVTFTPPSNLPGSEYYAVRVTASVDGPHYSHQFRAGNPAITDAMTTSSAKPTRTSTTAKTTNTQEEEVTSASSASSSKSASKSGSSKPSSKQTSTDSEDSSEESEDSSESESSEDSSDSSSESDSDSSSSNSAAHPAVVAAGAFGAAIIVALF
ncbi:hypothetical protein IWW39_004759 [Coemansia spiralis]|uniref:Yeast cell wall synthesis Kre9/Knh1-like N-terminal domain-containing protein n=1 Tax=Coemansia spiralis TaxID=417178 RepID=A0A9W8GG98_9FUNG|nr:hypothetical protein IWW39_004759 [Coemansia spiralis]